MGKGLLGSRGGGSESRKARSQVTHSQCFELEMGKLRQERRWSWFAVVGGRTGPSPGLRECQREGVSTLPGDLWPAPRPSEQVGAES